MNGNEPAYPTEALFKVGKPIMLCDSSPGLTKRELFAAIAMQGLLTSCVDPEVQKIHEVSIVQCAVRCADALIEALNGGAK